MLTALPDVNPEKTNQSRGFTLIEILIVIFIISLVASIAMLTISHNQNKQFEYWSKYFTNLLTLAEEEAMLRPTTLGVQFTKKDVTFYEFAEDTSHHYQWVRISEGPFKQHFFPKQTHIQLRLGKKFISLETVNAPQIIITSGGEITPFTLYVGKSGHTPQYQINGIPNGTVVSERVRES